MTDEIFNQEVSEEEMNNRMAAVELVALHSFSNDELVAFNLAIQLYGKVNKHNMSYNKAMDLKLIRQDGTAWDIDRLKRVAAIEVNDRHEKGLL